MLDGSVTCNASTLCGTCHCQTSQFVTPMHQQHKLKQTITCDTSMNIEIKCVACICALKWQMSRFCLCNELQATAFREISIMQRLSRSPGVCQLHDYGITNDSILLVMPKYKCSLHEWRQGQPIQPQHQLRLYLNIFCKIAELVQVVLCLQLCSGCCHCRAVVTVQVCICVVM